MLPPKKLLLTWDSFDEAISACHHELQHAKTWDPACPGIYGIPRGGLVVAVALSHHLDLPVLDTPQENCIIVDDVIETGKTLAETLRRCNALGIDDDAVLVWAWLLKNSALRSNFDISWHRYVEPGTWIVFPWESWEKADQDYAEYTKKHEAPFFRGAYDDVSGDAD